MARSAIAIALVVMSTGCVKSGQPATALQGPQVKLALARVLIEHRAWDAAVRPLREAMAARPDDAEAHTLLGVVYRERGLLEAAEAELRKATKLDVTASAPHGDLAIVLDLAGRHEEAIEEHRRAVALAPSVAAWHNNLGWSLLVAGRASEAMVELKEALRCDPSSARARNNLAFAMGREGQVEEAVRQFGRAGTEAQVANNVGLLFEARGDRGLACDRYREAVAMDPQLAAATKNLARACGAGAGGSDVKRVSTRTEDR
jgi:Flp pilus assembly protein TadD